MEGLDFSNAKFTGANLSRAKLENARFRRSVFRDAILADVNARGAEFQGADLRAADLSGADLTGANFDAAKVEGALLSEEQLSSLIDQPLSDHFFDGVADAGRSAPGGFDPQPTLAVAKKPHYLVLFGTNRRPNPTPKDISDFGSERDTQLNLGSCEVAIPESHQIGSIGSKFWGRLFKGDDRLNIRKLVVLNGELYWKLVNQNFSLQDQHTPPTIFIHGYNTTLKGAVLRAAQIGFDLGLEKGISLFSWPSHGTVEGYAADEATVEASRPYLVEFLLRYLEETNGAGVNVIAHSMGCRCLIAALENIGLKHPEKLPLFNQIILAAADLDQGVMQNLGSYAVQNSGRTTSYASPKDLALASSSWHHSFARVGFVPPIFLLEDMDTVEVSRTDLLELGHGYVASARSVLGDMFEVIKNSTPPEQRFSIQAADPAAPTHWKLKE
jgi:esterase/lipase superfamily enzyme